MDSSSFISAIVLLVLVTDPLGNIPIFVGLLVFQRQLVRGLTAGAVKG